MAITTTTTTKQHSEPLQQNPIWAALILLATSILFITLLANAHTGNASPNVAVGVLNGDAEAGRGTFMSTCASCHAPNGMGIRYLGKRLVGSEFVNGLTDVELLAFLQVGRDVNDPLNTTGNVMPARGGRPTLTDDDLANVIAYIRQLNAEAAND